MSIFTKLFKKRPQAPTPAPQQPLGPNPNFGYPPYMPVRRQVNFGWGKAAGMLFAVIIPGVLVIAANKTVFPEASWLATGMVVTTIGIAIIFAVASALATPKVRRYVLIATFAIDLVLAGNLAFHWVLAREISGAKQATTERHSEEDRADKRAEAEVKRRKDLLESETKRLKAEAWRNAEARKLGIQAPRGTRISAPASESTAETAAAVTATLDKALTVEEVMKYYTPFLLAFAIAELLVSVVAFGICALAWEWDKNGDGIADHLQHAYLSGSYNDPRVAPWASPWVQDPNGQWRLRNHPPQQSDFPTETHPGKH